MTFARLVYGLPINVIGTIVWNVDNKTTNTVINQRVVYKPPAHGAIERWEQVNNQSETGVSFHVTALFSGADAELDFPAGTIADDSDAMAFVTTTATLSGTSAYDDIYVTMSYDAPGFDIVGPVATNSSSVKLGRTKIKFLQDFTWHGPSSQGIVIARDRAMWINHDNHTLTVEIAKNRTGSLGDQFIVNLSIEYRLLAAVKIQKPIKMLSACITRSRSMPVLGHTHAPIRRRHTICGFSQPEDRIGNWEWVSEVP
uniref:Capsid protein n=1 Tax=Suncus murinus ribovirus 3 TaxID=3139577 RepID=A0AB38ZKD1_9VIRU